MFFQNTLKSKACDKSIQVRTKLCCHVIVKNYLCNVLCKFLINFESLWRYEIKELIPKMTLLYYGRTVRSSHRMFSIKKLFLKFRNIQKKHLCLSLFFKKLQVWRPATLLKKDPNTVVLLWVNIAKFLRLRISKNIYERLLFYCFNGLLLHGPKVSRSRLYDGVGVQGLSHGSIFLFLSHLLPWT